MTRPIAMEEKLGRANGEELGKMLQLDSGAKIIAVANRK